VPDAAERLNQLTQNLSGTSFDLTSTFTYNPAGQIATKTTSNDAAYLWTPSVPNSTLLAQFDGQNQLTSFGGTTVTDDSDGNVVTGINSLSYTFDALGQLRTASGGSSTVDVDYDPAGMLHSVSTGGTTTDYLYDGDDLVAQYDGSGNITRRFVHGAGSDEPLVIYEGSGTGSKTWLHADERGSIIAASNASGAAASSVKYTNDGESGALVSPFGYTGQLYLPELQLYYYKARMYSPKTGRFLQPDPIGYAGGMNLYAYAGNDPVNMTDPTGLLCYAWGGGDSTTTAVPYDGSGVNTFIGHSISRVNCIFDIPVPYIEPAPQPVPNDDEGAGAPQGDQQKAPQCPEETPSSGYWSRVGSNFGDTNKGVPGLLAPTGLGLLTAGRMSEAWLGTNAATFGRWAFSGFRGFQAGAATFTSLESGILVGTSAALNFSYTGVSFEVGVLGGSMISAIPNGSGGSVRDSLATGLYDLFGPESNAAELACGW
jgi:RHS repeat-associated protein